jgi:uncharacterized membrane protein
MLYSADAHETRKQIRYCGRPQWVPVNIPREVCRKWYALRALAVALAVFAVVSFILWHDASGIRSIGLLAILLCGWLVRRSNALVSRAKNQVFVEPDKQVGPLAWTLTAASLVAVVVFYFLMYVGDQHGWKYPWPVYGFFGAGLALTMTTGYVVIKMLQLRNTLPRGRIRGQIRGRTARSPHKLHFSLFISKRCDRALSSTSPPLFPYP